jgi:hypothetical protein
MNSICRKLLEEGKGILRLAPAWVPRSFCRPGKRIKLHPEDYYVFGLARGGIDERWFSSTTHAENGPNTPDDEGMSYVVSTDGSERVLLKDLVAELKGQAIGDDLWDKYQGWPIYSKLFDNLGPLPHHVHHNDEAAKRVGQKGKHEMYFYPAQLNNHGGEFPYTFFGFNPGVTKHQVKETLMNFGKGDNQITNLSRSYKLTLDTGFDVPPGILHAPGSLCTYEPQFASDVYAMYQSVLVGEHAVPEALLWKDTPLEEVGNYDYLIDILDWEANTDPDFYQRYFMAPKLVRPLEEMQAEGYVEEWICYKSKQVSAKRLTVLPGKTVVIRDSAAYGMYMLQGHGKFGEWDIETPALIRYGELTHDEYFVTAPAANAGVRITNHSKLDPIVLLKHFSENLDLRMG